MYAYSINKLTLLVLFISEKNLVSQCSLQCVYTCNKYEQPSINKHRDIGITVDISCQFQLNLYTMHSTSCTEPSESQHLLDNSACRTICLTRIKKIQNISTNLRLILRKLYCACKKNKSNAGCQHKVEFRSVVKYQFTI